MKAALILVLACILMVGLFAGLFAVFTPVAHAAAENYYYENATLVATTSIVPTVIQNFTVNVGVTGNYMILGSCDIFINATTASRRCTASILVDGVTIGQANTSNKKALDTFTVTAVKNITLAAGSHYITIEWYVMSASTPGYMRNVRLFAMRLNNTCYYVEDNAYIYLGIMNGSLT